MYTAYRTVYNYLYRKPESIYFRPVLVGAANAWRLAYRTIAMSVKGSPNQVTINIIFKHVPGIATATNKNVIHLFI